MSLLMVTGPSRPWPVSDGAGGEGGGLVPDFTAASGNTADVEEMLDDITEAGAGKIGLIPAGTWNWTTGITWTAPANTILIGAGSLSTLGGGDTTVIVDNYASGSPLLVINAAATGVFRLAGLTVNGGSGSLKDNGVVILNGPATARVDHVHFDMTTYSPDQQAKPLWIGDRVYGVIDHLILDAHEGASIYFANGAGVDGQGNTAWAAATAFGGADFMFVEDSIINGNTTGPGRLGDTFSAGRVVWRFNTIQGGGGLELHATGHSGDDRGARAQEGYGNHFTVLPGQSQPPFSMADLSSGGALIWGNTANTDALKNIINFNVTRKNNDTYAQPATPTGWGYCGTEFNGTGSNWDQNASASLGYACLDQPGRGQGDLLTGTFGVGGGKLNDTTGTIAWPNQALEPIYLWKNSAAPAAGWGGAFYRDATLLRVVANRDYYPQASGIQTNATTPFDGTVGCGWGTIANRPTTCTVGVAYWATDEGAWNQSASNPQGVNQAGASGRLYVCTSTNVWTLYYTPYTYPHPLNT